MRTSDSHCRLYLRDRHVGDVHVRKTDGSWGFGDFTPNEHFSEFAGLFGSWSLLMHADEADAVLSPAASEELRRVEYLLDSLKAELRWPDTEKTAQLSQVNIDGAFIEWKLQ